MNKQINKFNKNSQERLTEIKLKQMSINDAGAYFKLINDNRDYFANFNNLPINKYINLEEVEKTLLKNNDKIIFGIYLEKKLIGTINITPLTRPTRIKIALIGYLIAKKYAGKGNGTKALLQLDKLIAKKYDRFMATTHPNNIASQRVLEKAGFEKVGVDTQSVDQDYVFEKRLNI